MKTFTVYDKNTGNILRSGSCQDIDFDRQAMKENEAVIEGEGNDLLDRVVLPANGTKPYIRSRGKTVAAQVAAQEAANRALIEGHLRDRRAAAAAPMEVLVEALRTKGIDVSSADLTAAAQGLLTRRTAVAPG